jgi:hypothetical protein
MSRGRQNPDTDRETDRPNPLSHCQNSAPGRESGLGPFFGLTLPILPRRMDPSSLASVRGRTGPRRGCLAWRSPSQRHIFFVAQPGSTPPLSWRCSTDGASFIAAHVGGEVGAASTILRLGGIASLGGWGVFVLPMSARLDYRGQRFLSNDERVF